MAKQRKRRADETAALFVRLPLEEAEKLDRFAFERRMPKRDVVRRLVADRLDDADVIWHRPAPPPFTMPLPRDAEVVVGRADFVTRTGGGADRRAGGRAAADRPRCRARARRRR